MKKQRPRRSLLLFAMQDTFEVVIGSGANSSKVSESALRLRRDPIHKAANQVRLLRGVAVFFHREGEEHDMVTVCRHSQRIGGIAVVGEGWVCRADWRDLVLIRVIVEDGMVNRNGADAICDRVAV